MKKVLFFSCMILLPWFIRAQSIVINELMAKNNSTITDNMGEYDDWFEIYNYGLTTVDIGGFYVTDSLPDPSKYLIPTGNDATKIAPGGFLLIWADSQPEQGVLHVGFKLSASGEQLGIFKPDLTVIDQVTFSAQNADVSYGRLTDNSPTWGFLPSPSPGWSNNPDYIYLSTDSVNLSSVNGSNAVIVVHSNVAWTASSNQGWLSVAPSGGTGILQVTVTATANTSVSSRTATVTFQASGATTQILTVNQIGDIPLLEVSDNSVTLDYHANSTATVDIFSNISWTTSSDHAWLQATPSGGSNSGTLTLTITSQNPASINRVATLTISGPGVTDKTISVTQLGTPALPTIVINELMSSNSSVITDNHGEYEDWVEIFNFGSAPVNLAGLYFTNNLLEPLKYQMPSGNDSTILAAGEFKVLWADNNTAQGILHLNFKLSQSGDYFGIYLSADYVIDSISFPFIATNTSYGRYPDNSGTWYGFYDPTPGATNILKVEEYKGSDLRLFPDPVSENLNIDMGNASDATVEIIDFSGKTVLSGNYHENLVQVNVSNLTGGIYMIRIKNAGTIYCGKIIIDR